MMTTIGRTLTIIRIFPFILFMIMTACQHNRSAPGIAETILPKPTHTQGAIAPISVVTQVVPSPEPVENTAQPEIKPTRTLTISPTANTDVDRPLLIPRILQAEYSRQATRLVIGFDIHPAYRGNPEVFGEIYDATLIDQIGREIAGISMERTEPEKSILEFTPLPAGVTDLTLRAQLAIRGIPAEFPLIIDVSGHPLDQPWSIQTQARFGDAMVRLHSARLSREEIGPPTDVKQQINLELRGENADMNGAQLICLVLSPLPPPVEGSMSCGQEPGGIDASVSLGLVVDRRATLPMPVGLVILRASADFLLPRYWETSWAIE